MRRLQQPVPKKALRLFVDAQRASESHRPLVAVAKLEEAIRIFPDYSEARCNLGVQYIRLSRFAEAVEQFDKAIAIDATALSYSNLSYALLELGRIAEAEQAGRLAIAKDSSSGPAHYLLGIILARQRKTEEALYHLRVGARSMPKAHLEVAKMERAPPKRCASI